MAQLILTEDEKQTSSYLDWSDEALGRLVKKVAINFASDKEAVQATSTALLLVGFVAETGSTKAELKFQDVTEGETQLGNWTITVLKTD